MIAPDANGISKIATIGDRITTVRTCSAQTARLPLTTAPRRRGQDEGHAWSDLPRRSTPGSAPHGYSTVSASILGSFVFRVTSFTPPARAPVTPAAVHERLAGAPMRTARLGHVEVAITFVEFELLARSGAPRGQRESAALSSRFLRAGQANSASYIHHVLFAAGCAVCGVHMPVLHRRREVRRREWLASNPAAHKE